MKVVRFVTCSVSIVISQNYHHRQKQINWLLNQSKMEHLLSI